jgi:hypothetical protein
MEVFARDLKALGQAKVEKVLQAIAIVGIRPTGRPGFLHYSF